MAHERSLTPRSRKRNSYKPLEEELLALAEDIAATRGLKFFSRLVDKTKPVAIPSRILGIRKEECEKLGYPYLSLVSGAGHDAQIVSSVTDAGMIFIPCLDGISHSPEEMIRFEDLEKGANLLLQALMRLAG